MVIRFWPKCAIILVEILHPPSAIALLAFCRQGFHSAFGAKCAAPSFVGINQRDVDLTALLPKCLHAQRKLYTTALARVLTPTTHFHPRLRCPLLQGQQFLVVSFFPVFLDPSTISLVPRSSIRRLAAPFVSSILILPIRRLFSLLCLSDGRLVLRFMFLRHLATSLLRNPDLFFSHFSVHRN